MKEKIYTYIYVIWICFKLAALRKHVSTVRDSTSLELKSRPMTQDSGILNDQYLLQLKEDALGQGSPKDEH